MARPKFDEAVFDPGNLIFGWLAHDYHPHQRGILWHIVFCLIFFGGAAWSIHADPKWGWITATAFCVTAAIYFQIHRNGNQDHDIKILEKGLLIDNKIFTGWGQFKGYWFNVDETVSTVIFELKESKKQHVIQLGQLLPDQIRAALADIEKFDELKNKKEGLLDLWIRALKL